VFLNFNATSVRDFMRPPASPVILQHMTYYGSKELASAFRTVRKNTIQIAEEIPEEKYNFQPAPGTRTVARTLAHIAALPSFNRKWAILRRCRPTSISPSSAPR
jgi:hypothetical protein